MLLLGSEEIVAEVIETDELALSEEVLLLSSEDVRTSVLESDELEL